MANDARRPDDDGAQGGKTCAFMTTIPTTRNDILELHIATPVTKVGSFAWSYGGERMPTNEWPQPLTKLDDSSSWSTCHRAIYHCWPKYDRVWDCQGPRTSVAHKPEGFHRIRSDGRSWSGMLRSLTAQEGRVRSGDGKTHGLHDAAKRGYLSTLRECLRWKHSFLFFIIQASGCRWRHFLSWGHFPCLRLRTQDARKTKNRRHSVIGSTTGSGRSF